MQHVVWKVLGMVLGTILLVLVGCIWIRSYSVRDHVAYRRPAGGRFQVLSCRGKVTLWAQRYDWSRRPDVNQLGLRTEGERLRDGAPGFSYEHPRWSFVGFGYDSGLQGTRLAHWEITLPYWFFGFLLVSGLVFGGSRLACCRELNSE